MSVLKKIEVDLSIVQLLQQFPEITPLNFDPIKEGILYSYVKKVGSRRNMASRSRKKRIREANIRDPIRAVYAIAYISPATVNLGPPDCDVQRLRTFFYKVCELITDEANFVDAIDILMDMKLALQSHVDYYRDQEYKDFQRLYTAIDAKIIPAILLAIPTYDATDVQADLGYIQMIMKHIYEPPSQDNDHSTCGPASTSGSIHPSDRNSEFHSERLSEHISEQFTDHTSEHSSTRGLETYTHKSSSRVSRLFIRILQCLQESTQLKDVNEYIQTLITNIATTYYSNQKLERIQDKLISVIGNVNHGVHPIIIKLRVDFIKELLENCAPK